jgi:hypothetical protein
MKKFSLSIAVLAVVASMASCGSSSSYSSDVKKMAEYMCKMQKLKAASDEKSVKELADVKKEMDEFDTKMAAKYKDMKKDSASMASAEKIMKEVMEKCK